MEERDHGGLERDRKQRQKKKGKMSISIVTFTFTLVQWWVVVWEVPDKVRGKDDDEGW